MFGLVDYSSGDENGENQEEDEEPRDEVKSTMEGEERFPPTTPAASQSTINLTNSNDTGNGNGLMSNRIPNQQTAERMKHYVQLKAQGYNLTDSIRKKKDFGNPYILRTTLPDLSTCHLLRPHLLHLSLFPLVYLYS